MCFPQDLEDGQIQFRDMEHSSQEFLGLMRMTIPSMGKRTGGWVARAAS